MKRVLGPDDQVIEAVYLWTRHRWMLWFGAGAFMVLFATAEFAGFDDVAGQIALGFAGVAVAVTATTEYRIVALTDRGRYLLRASRIRRVATALLERLDPNTKMALVGGTVLAVDWQVGDRRYTVTKSGEAAMHRIAESRR